MQKTKKYDLTSLVSSNSLIGLDLNEGNSSEKRYQTCTMIHVNKTFPAGSVVFAFTHCFHRHIDLCGMFDRPLCRKVVATYMLKRKGKIATHDIPLQC